MVYGELGDKALSWATRFVFGIDPLSIPSEVVITPFKVEEYFDNFQSLMTAKGLTIDKYKGFSSSSFLVQKGGKQVLFCQGDVGASNFADSSYILCHCANVEEIIFIGTGGGIGENVESADINLPTSCIRLDKVLEIMLPREAPAKANLRMVKRIKSLIDKETRDLGIKVHTGKHATVPFFLSETKQLLTNLQKQGALSIDMELSVLYALANHCNKRAAGIIRIGDLPLKGLPVWKSRSYKTRLKKKVHTRILNAVINYLFI